MMGLRGKIAICFVVCVAFTSCSANESRGPDSIYYRDEARTFYERFVRDARTGIVRWEGGNIRSSRNTAEQKQDALFDEFTGALLHDCSDAQYRCVYGIYRVFAVPREGLTPQSTYRAGGALFHVENSSSVRALV